MTRCQGIREALGGEAFRAAAIGGLHGQEDVSIGRSSPSTVWAGRIIDLFGGGRVQRSLMFVESLVYNSRFCVWGLCLVTEGFHSHFSDRTGVLRFAHLDPVVAGP